VVRPAPPEFVGDGQVSEVILGRVFTNAQIAAPLFMFHLHRLSKKDVAGFARRTENLAPVVPYVSLPASLGVGRRPELALDLDGDAGDVTITKQLRVLGELCGDGLEEGPAIRAGEWPRQTMEGVELTVGKAERSHVGDPDGLRRRNHAGHWDHQATIASTSALRCLQQCWGR